MCAQMACCTNATRESALKVDSERKNLAALGTRTCIEPGFAFQSDALPAGHPAQFCNLDNTSSVCIKVHSL